MVGTKSAKPGTPTMAKAAGTMHKVLTGRVGGERDVSVEPDT